MGYRVIKYFTDLKDHNHEYQVGDIFPHEGLEVSEERYKELSSSANRRGIPLIEKIEEIEETEEINDEPIVEESKENPTKEKKPTTSTTKKASSASKAKKERTKKNAE